MFIVVDSGTGISNHGSTENTIGLVKTADRVKLVLVWKRNKEGREHMDIFMET